MSRFRWKWLVLGAKSIIAVAVTLGILHFFSDAVKDLRSQDFSLRDIQFGWVMLAGTVYLVGLLPAGLFWHRVLLAVGEHPRCFDTLRAYYIGHLGKYVPGKAMVVILRAGLIDSDRVDRTTAGVTVFLETLTQMTVGAAVAFAVIGLRYREHVNLVVMALVLMVGAGLPTIPRIFRRLVYWSRVARFSSEINRRLEGIRFPLVLMGWASNFLGWLLLGFSLWAVLRCLPLNPAKLELSVEVHLLLSAAVALAVVGGFLSLIPGGLGVREVVLIPLLAQELQLNVGMAVAASIILRLIWILSELTAAGILYVFGTRPIQP